MIDQLDDISRMGFNAVWLGPLHPVSMVPKSAEDHTKGRSGSLYAIVEAWHWRGDFFGTDDVEKQKELLKQYTAKAKSLGLTPMFDLVLKHMGRSNAEAPNHLLDGTDTYLRDSCKIDTTRWFASEVTQIAGQTWDDVVPFNYNDASLRQQIMQHLWKPYIDMHIKEAGI